MTASSTIKRWSLLLTAGALGAVTGIHLVLSPRRLVEVLFADGLALLLLTAVAHVGYRLAAEESPEFTAITTAWTLAGVGGLALLDLWLLTFDRLTGVAAAPPLATTLMFLAVGALFGLSLGLNDARRRERSSELSAERERVAFLNDLLRHNVLNALQVILGAAERIETRADGTAPTAGTDGGTARPTASGAAADDAAMIRQWASDTARQVRKMRLLTGGDGARTGPVRLDAVLEEQAEKIRSSTAAEIDLDVPAGLWVRADEALAALVESLLLNAVDHGADGEGVRVAVVAECEPDAVTVRIVDDGPGLPADIERAINRARPEPDVFGFGLYLVSTLVSRYGGEFRAGEAARGDVDLQGAALAVRLPRADAEA